MAFSVQVESFIARLASFSCDFSTVFRVFLANTFGVDIEAFIAFFTSAFSRSSLTVFWVFLANTFGVGIESFRAVFTCTLSGSSETVCG